MFHVGCWRRVCQDLVEETSRTFREALGGLLSSWDLTVTSSAHWPSPTHSTNCRPLLFPTFVSSDFSECVLKNPKRKKPGGRVGDRRGKRNAGALPAEKVQVIRDLQARGEISGDRRRQKTTARPSLSPT